MSKWLPYPELQTNHNTDNCQSPPTLAQDKELLLRTKLYTESVPILSDVYSFSQSRGGITSRLVRCYHCTYFRCRFVGGINGRVPRVCHFLNKESLVDADTVQTILLVPSAMETLSESKWLRLEIGIAPNNNWTYQTKVVDYLFGFQQCQR